MKKIGIMTDSHSGILVNCKTKFHSQILKLEVNLSQKTLEVNSSEKGLQ